MKPFLPSSDSRADRADGAAGRISDLLSEIQASLFDDARDFRDKNTFTPKDFEEFISDLAETNLKD